MGSNTSMTHGRDGARGGQPTTGLAEGTRRVRTRPGNPPFAHEDLLGVEKGTMKLQLALERLDQRPEAGRILSPEETSQQISFGSRSSVAGPALKMLWTYAGLLGQEYRDAAFVGLVRESASSISSRIRAAAWFEFVADMTFLDPCGELVRMVREEGFHITMTVDGTNPARATYVISGITPADGEISDVGEMAKRLSGLSAKVKAKLIAQRCVEESVNEPGARPSVGNLNTASVVAPADEASNPAEPVVIRPEAASRGVPWTEGLSGVAAAVQVKTPVRE